MHVTTVFAEVASFCSVLGRLVHACERELVAKSSCMLAYGPMQKREEQLARWMRVRFGQGGARADACGDYVRYSHGGDGGGEMATVAFVS